jgi:uncharacterized protein YbjT (DUF2867 family)
MTPILVTGGTGTLGRAVVAELTAAGLPVRVLSRRPGPDRVVADLVTSPALSDALSDVDTIVHLATTLRGGRDVTATRNLVAAATGVRHLVFVSIVGVDRVPLGYYEGKLAAEELVSTVPHTILRATQFHDLVHTMLAGAAKVPPLMPVPALRAQPVDVRDVAVQLAELAQGPPRGRAPDFGGPEVHSLTELAAEYLRATGRRRKQLPIRLPGKAFRGYREGGHLAAPGSPTGTITFAEYLAERTAS